jgi:hypothetical protein
LSLHCPIGRLEAAKPPKKTWASNGVDNYHTNSRLPQGLPLMHFKGAGSCLSLQNPHIQAKPAVKANKVENLMTLKQACSSEYQGAQDAFKDSMIH